MTGLQDRLLFPPPRLIAVLDVGRATSHPSPAEVRWPLDRWTVGHLDY